MVFKINLISFMLCRKFNRRSERFGWGGRKERLEEFCVALFPLPFVPLFIENVIGLVSLLARSLLGNDLQDHEKNLKHNLLIFIQSRMCYISNYANLRI